MEGSSSPHSSLWEHPNWLFWAIMGHLYPGEEEATALGAVLPVASHCSLINAIYGLSSNSDFYHLNL